jgi:hypothetical protein
MYTRIVSKRDAHYILTSSSLQLASVLEARSIVIVLNRTILDEVDGVVSQPVLKIFRK